MTVFTVEVKDMKIAMRTVTVAATIGDDHRLRITDVADTLIPDLGQGHIHHVCIVLFLLPLFPCFLDHF